MGRVRKAGSNPRPEAAGGSYPPAGAVDQIPNRLLIVSDIRFYREDLAEVFARDGVFVIAGIADDAEQAPDLSRRLQPQILLIDAVLLGGPGAVRRLAELMPQTPIVALALADIEADVIAWTGAGILDYVPRTTPLTELVGFLSDVMRGKQVCSTDVAAGLLRWISQASRAGNARQLPAESPALTLREEQVVRLICSGLSNKKISRRLNVGLSTTKSHVHIRGFWEAFMLPHDPNNLLCQTRKALAADPTAGGNLDDALARSTAKTFVGGFTGDVMFPPEDCERDAARIPRAQFQEIHSIGGHLSTFALFKPDRNAIDDFLRNVLAS
jgi:DNA-binding NarL/FixJ family response regulator